MRYSLGVEARSGVVLDFPEYGEGEYYLAVALARRQSKVSVRAWVFDNEQQCVKIRYLGGVPVAAADTPDAWLDDHASHFTDMRPELARELAREIWDGDLEDVL